jgi:hypothetical protein
MNWLLEFLAALRSADHGHPTNDMVAVLHDTSFLAAFSRLSWRLQLLYGVSAAIALSFIATGISVSWLRIAAGELAPSGAATILVVGGVGLLYECVLGIELDARR